MAECGSRSVIAHPASGFSDRDKLNPTMRSNAAAVERKNALRALGRIEMVLFQYRPRQCRAFLALLGRFPSEKSSYWTERKIEFRGYTESRRLGRVMGAVEV
jgi:hypothetical protein